MFGLLVRLVLVMTCLCHFATAEKANIITPPRPVNVSVNTVAVFTCTAVANSFTWHANGQQIDEDDEEKVVITTTLLNSTPNTRMSMLELTVSSTGDATNITCNAISELPSLTSDESDPALLLVQGLLDSVNDLTVDSINSTTVLISWSPPFSLKGVPILHYIVIITNTTSGDEIIETLNTTMQYYIFSTDSPDPNSEFNVTVIPINIVGAGKVSLDFKFSVKEVIISSTVPASSSTGSSIVVTTSDKPRPIGTVMPSDGGFVPTLGSPIIGAIIGIGVGCIVAVVCIILLLILILVYCSSKKNKQGNNIDEYQLSLVENSTQQNDARDSNGVSPSQSNGSIFKATGPANCYTRVYQVDPKEASPKRRNRSYSLMDIVPPKGDALIKHSFSQ